MSSYRDGRKYSVRGLHYSNKHDALSSVGKLKNFDITDNRKYALARRYYSLARKEATETKDPRVKIDRLGAAATYLKYINSLVKDGKITTKKEGTEMGYDSILENFLSEIISEDAVSAKRFLKHAHVKSKFKRYYKTNTVPYWAVYQKVLATPAKKGKGSQSDQPKSEPKSETKPEPKKSKPASSKSEKAKKAKKVVSKKSKPKKKVEVKRKSASKTKKLTGKKSKVNESFSSILEFKTVNPKRQKLYSHWKELINMGPAQLKKYMHSKVGRHSGLSRSQAAKHGIKSGRDSAKAVVKMLQKGHNKWNENDWRWAGRQVSFISRMKGNKGPTKDDKGNLTRKAMSLKIWGHNPGRK